MSGAGDLFSRLAAGPGGDAVRAAPRVAGRFEAAPAAHAAAGPDAGLDVALATFAAAPAAVPDRNGASDTATGPDARTGSPAGAGRRDAAAARAAAPALPPRERSPAEALSDEARDPAAPAPRPPAASAIEVGAAPPAPAAGAAVVPAAALPLAAGHPSDVTVEARPVMRSASPSRSRIALARDLDSPAGAEPPTVTISIGRVEVRANLHAPAAPRRTSTQEPVGLPLGDYLRGKRGAP